jgi:hypothetical protein
MRREEEEEKEEEEKESVSLSIIPASRVIHSSSRAFCVAFGGVLHS